MNKTKQITISKIRALHEKGYSNRHIQERLHVSGHTIIKYVKNSTELICAGYYMNVIENKQNKRYYLTNAEFEESLHGHGTNAYEKKCLNCSHRIKMLSDEDAGGYYACDKYADCSKCNK